MEYALICGTFALSLVSLIVSLKLVRRFETIETVKKKFDEEIKSAKAEIEIFRSNMTAFENNLISNTKKTIDELNAACEIAKDLHQMLKSDSKRLYVVDNSMVRTFIYDSFMENENAEQQAADNMLKHQTDIIIKTGGKILDSSVKLVDIPKGTAHRVTITYLVKES